MSCSLWRSSKQAPPSQNSVMILQSKLLRTPCFRGSLRIFPEGAALCLNVGTISIRMH